MFMFRNQFVPRLMLLFTLLALLAACGGTPTTTGSTPASTSASTATAASTAAFPAASASAEASTAASGSAEASTAASGSAEASTAASGNAGASTAPANLGDATIRFLSGQAEDVGYTKIIGMLAKEFEQQNPSIKYEYEQTPQTGIDQQIQLLAGANNLPTLFPSPATATLNEMFEKGLVLDIEKTFTELGLMDKLNPAAIALAKNLGGGTMNVIPTELNIEGIWYNKKIFADNGLQAPTTWAELVQAADTLNAAAVQPFAASGQQGWPLTRLIGGYAERKYGPDVMDRVAKGELKLTDAGFVEAAKAVQDLGIKGYFGEGVTTIEYDTALDQFLQGQAAMFYMGSWELRSFNDPARNQIGADNIGLFNLPTVEGGAGTADDWSMNVGLPVAVSQAKYNENPQAVGEWMKYVFSQYGDRSMSELGAITGFKVENMPANLPSLTGETLQTVQNAKTPFLYFEGRFNSEATTLATQNVQQLITGDMTPEDYLSQIQQALDNQ